MIVRARAPYRILDLGGWTDCVFVPQGVVTNVAITLGVSVYLETGRTPEGLCLSTDGDLVAGSHQEVLAKATGPHALLAAAVDRTVGKVKGGLYLETRADLPVGSGVGGSATTAVAALAALHALSGDTSRSPAHLAEQAHALEVEDLGLVSGIQDQWAAVLGGVNRLDVTYPRLVSQDPLRLHRDTLRELERRLVLCYVGTPHLSSDIHGEVMALWEAGCPAARAAIHSLRACGESAYRILAQGHLDQLGPIIDANWDAQVRLSAAVTTPEVSMALGLAKAHGGYGKANGAGGGGTVTCLAAANRVGALRKALDAAGYRTYPVRVSQHGVEVW